MSKKNKKQKMRNIAFITGLFSLFSFIYKLGLGIYSMSLVLIIASFSTLIVFICKMTFVRTVTKTRAKKKKAYLSMILMCLVYVLIFLLFVVLKVNGIDISTQKTYTGWLGGLLISFMVVMFIMSIIKLRGALEKTDLIVIGLKEVIYISALADVVIIENYAYGMYLNYNADNKLWHVINEFLPLGLGVLMTMTLVFMFIRYSRYKVETNN